MGKKRLIAAGLITFVVVLLVNLPAVYAWNLFRHGEGAFDWLASLIIAITLALALPAVWLAKRPNHQPR